MTEIFNRKVMKERRQMLRRNMSEAERILWSKLRRKQVDGFRFRRQYSAGAYVFDFYCPEIRFDVEVDGEGHDRHDAMEYDRERDEQLKNLGITILRFTNEQVKSKIDYVVQCIRETSISLRTTFPLTKGEIQRGSK